MINEDQLHELARIFMDQFPSLTPMSLDEFLEEYVHALTAEQYDLGVYILELFDNFYFKPE
jgi:hypothetical protein